MFVLIFISGSSNSSMSNISRSVKITAFSSKFSNCLIFPVQFCFFKNSRASAEIFLILLPNLALNLFIKLFTSSGISSFLSFKEGNFILTTFSLYKRSSLNSPDLTSFSRSLLVAVINLAFTFISFTVPKGVTTLS